MRKVSILLLVSFICLGSSGQFPVSTDSLYTFIKSNSILRKSADWKEIDQAYYKQIKEAKSLKDTMNCFVTVLKKLNDVHSQLFLNNQYYGHYPAFDDSTLAWLKPLNDRAVSVTNQVITETIVDNIGYIRIPSFQVFDAAQINNLAQSLADSVTAISLKSKKGLVIDLRLNGGGNIYPMLSGLSILLGNRIIGYETDADDSIARTWEIKNGNFVIGGYQTSSITVRQVSGLDNLPVVILTGPVTKSAGSMTAITFKGRPNTLFIGEPTADGYTTSNGYFQFAPNLFLNFATHYVADRNKIKYKTVVDPDIFVLRGDNFDNLKQDKKISVAIEWLSAKYGSAQ